MNTPNLLILSLFLLTAGCSTHPVRTFDKDSPILPDLLIRKVTYRSLGADQRIRTRASSLQIDYEFQVQVVNAGNGVFGEQFYISLTTRLDDYDTNQYGVHILVNEAQALLQPGQSMNFRVQASVEYPRPPVPAFLPMRFYLNTEGLGTTSVLTVRNIPEHDYRNNVYEISMRTIQRL